MSEYIFLQICLSCVCMQPLLILGHRLFLARIPHLARKWFLAAVFNGAIILLTAQISIWSYL